MAVVTVPTYLLQVTEKFRKSYAINKSISYRSSYLQFPIIGEGTKQVRHNWAMAISNQGHLKQRKNIIPPKKGD